MQPKVLGSILVGGTAIVTGAGICLPETALATGSVMLGGCAFVVSLYAWTQTAKQRVSTKMLEQLR